MSASCEKQSSDLEAVIAAKINISDQNKMTSLKTFTKFPELPPEIQLQIWESTIATQPAMHLFDVCVPPCISESMGTPIASPTTDSHDADREGTDRPPSKREAIYLEEATDTLYLSPLATTTDEDATPPGTEVSTQGARFRSDPSMYKFRANLAATCIDAAATVRRSIPVPSAAGDGSSSSSSGGDTNTIYLGAPSTARGCASITYDNTQDVLYLRFTPPPFRFPDKSGRLTSPLSAIFESVWSQELAGALHRARRVAIDVSQLWPDLWARELAGGGDGEQQGGVGADGEGQHEEAGEGEAEALGEGEEEEGEAGGNDDGSLIMQDIAFLACTMQHDLEVLYLVDNSAGRCDSHPSSLRARDLMDRRDEGLYRALRNGETWQKEKTRNPDVISGVGKVWREIFDLERLGWDEEHTGFVFAEMFAEVVKMQQGNWMGDDGHDGNVAKERVKFQGVRVLITEDEQINGEDSSMLLGCNGHRHGVQKEDYDL